MNIKKLEESTQIPEENNSVELSSEIKKEINKQDNIREFNEFLEKTSNQDLDEQKVNSNLEEKKSEIKDNSFFKKIINDGFDGIISNPNYKMLALLIILLVNLSLFFVIGNIGKAFLRTAGIM